MKDLGQPKQSRPNNNNNNNLSFLDQKPYRVIGGALRRYSYLVTSGYSASTLTAMDAKLRPKMSRLFRRPSTTKLMHTTCFPYNEDPNSVFSSLLDQDGEEPLSTVTSPTHSLAGHQQLSSRPQHPQQPPPQAPPHRRTKSSPAFLTSQDPLSSRPWLNLLVSEQQRSPRKLVKEPGGGSARPSFSFELGDSAISRTGDRRGDGDGERKGAVRRGVERIRELYKGGRGR